MALISIPSSSSSDTSTFKHNVFISFRGEETRYNFTSHLRKALRDKQIQTYIDEKLNRGDEISTSLLKAIEESQISIIIFSKDYASSGWCLQELVKILECKKSYGQIVIPVFYNVVPTDVRNQTGTFGDAFTKHYQKQSLDQVQRWKDALKEAANLSGLESSTIKDESVLIESIVEPVLKKLNDMSASDAKGLVGIDTEIEQYSSRHTNKMRGREKVKDSRLDSLCREESQVKFNGRFVRKDFREGLVSVFIDNLSPGVDVAVLWRFFKPFGNVRDVYLSSKKSFRRSCFGFIRFETVEEASNVAKMVNGMMVYGSPLRAKMASYGWNRRRSVEAKLYSGSEVEVLLKAGESSFKASYEGDQSFVEVGTGNLNRVAKESSQVVKKEINMCWNSQINEDEWLSRCAVGILKDFSNVSSVNFRLSSRGRVFSSSYLGDKVILWVFESVFERDDFVKNCFFWDDHFSSMEKWSESSITHSRLVWINCFGVPLRFWNEAFFIKLGWSLGEPMMVEEDTLSKTRLDRGRVLVRIQPNQVCPTKIKVSVDNGYFLVKISEEKSPVDLFSLSEFLGLKRIETKGNLKSLLDKARHEVDGFPSIVNQLDVVLGEEVDRGLFVKAEKVMDKSCMCQLMNKKGNGRVVKEGWVANANEGKVFYKVSCANAPLVPNKEDKASGLQKRVKRDVVLHGSVMSKDGKERKGLAKDICATSSLVSNQEDKALSFFKTSKGGVENQDKIRLGKDNERKRCSVFKGSLMQLWSEDKAREGCGKIDKDKDKGSGIQNSKGSFEIIKGKGSSLGNDGFGYLSLGEYIGGEFFKKGLGGLCWSFFRKRVGSLGG